MELEFECAGHADAVFVHCEPFVRVGRRKGPTRHQVVLVTGKDHPPTDRLEKVSLPLDDEFDDSACLIDGVLAHATLGREPRDAERNDSDRREFRKPFEDAGERVVEHVAVVDPRAHDDLSVHLDAVVEQCS